MTLRRAAYAVPLLVVVVVLGVLPPAAAAGLLTSCSAVIAVLMARAAFGGRAAGPRLRVLALDEVEPPGRQGGLRRQHV
ncbi:hypothetical protein AB0F81_21790, partial [Actinoplanes sp. NPDC024001]|uniref:hypothetical protein n=1 Tax=Actinoplanes sp. NPDC024001 TaxID=3154598 RepID=UPI0033CA80CF